MNTGSSEDNYDTHDGCLCGLDHSAHEATPDHELPAAQGGVQGDQKPRRKKSDRTAVQGEA
jgi:hypothetical protein